MPYNLCRSLNVKSLFNNDKQDKNVAMKFQQRKTRPPSPKNKTGKNSKEKKKSIQKD